VPAGFLTPPGPGRKPKASDPMTPRPGEQGSVHALVDVFLFGEAVFRGRQYVVFARDPHI
jgi:hypothetical protein